MEVIDARQFKLLKLEIAEYLKTHVQSMVENNYKCYIDIYPILYDIRDALNHLDGETAINLFAKLRKAIDKHEMAK